MTDKDFVLSTMKYESLEFVFFGAAILLLGEGVDRRARKKNIQFTVNAHWIPT